MRVQWIEVRLTIPSSLEEAASNRLFELGAQGVQGEMALGVAPAETTTLSAYFEAERADELRAELETYLTALREIFPSENAARLVIAPLADENWAERYKEFYKAQPMGKRFYLLPAWEKDRAVPDHRLPLVLEPGQAFGTGLHPSTQLSVSLMERVLDKSSSPASLDVIDVGTGTGILAMAAYKLGVRHLTAIDIDPIAVDTARENLAANGCEGVALSGEPLTQIRGMFDLILSNILLETHRHLAGEYRRLLKPRGHLILAGLLGHQRDEIESILAPLGFALEGVESAQEWLALLYVGKGA